MKLFDLRKWRQTTNDEMKMKGGVARKLNFSLLLCRFPHIFHHFEMSSQNEKNIFFNFKKHLSCSKWWNVYSSLIAQKKKKTSFHIAFETKLTFFSHLSSRFPLRDYFFWHFSVSLRRHAHGISLGKAMEKAVQLSALPFKNTTVNKSEVFADDSERYWKVQARGKVVDETKCKDNFEFLLKKIEVKMKFKCGQKATKLIKMNISI